MAARASNDTSASAGNVSSARSSRYSIAPAPGGTRETSPRASAIERGASDATRAGRESCFAIKSKTPEPSRAGGLNSFSRFAPPDRPSAGRAPPYRFSSRHHQFAAAPKAFIAEASSRPFGPGVKGGAGVVAFGDGLGYSLRNASG